MGLKLGGPALMVGMIDSILRAFLTTSGKLGSSKPYVLLASQHSGFLASRPIKMVILIDNPQFFLYDPLIQFLVFFKLGAKVMPRKYEDTKKNVRVIN